MAGRRHCLDAVDMLHFRINVDSWCVNFFKTDIFLRSSVVCVILFSTPFLLFSLSHLQSLLLCFSQFSLIFYFLLLFQSAVLFLISVPIFCCFFPISCFSFFLFIFFSIFLFLSLSFSLSVSLSSSHASFWSYFCTHSIVTESHFFALPKKRKFMWENPSSETIWAASLTKKWPSNEVQKPHTHT